MYVSVESIVKGKDNKVAMGLDVLLDNSNSYAGIESIT